MRAMTGIRRPNRLPEGILCLWMLAAPLWYLAECRSLFSLFLKAFLGWR
jgi:hypothetical protein